MDYSTMTTGQRAAYTRNARQRLMTSNPVAYRAIKAFSDGLSTEGVATECGISIERARGYRAALTRGAYSDCRFAV